VTLCSRKTRRGQPCQRLATSWVSLKGVTDPVACPTHTTVEERTALKEAEERWWEDLTAEAQATRRSQPNPAPVHTGPEPACWDWPLPVSFDTWVPGFEVGPGNDQYTQEAADDLLRLCGDRERRSSFYLSEWQDGRCAICMRGGHLIDDHDHATGLIRGLLCRSCNTREGLNQGSTGIFAAYRAKNPASILGLRIRYWDPFTGDYAQPTRT
jgi:hypothetical protein